jgi:hypothetical protein
MALKSMFRKASVALAAGAYALFVEAACLAQARTPVIAGPPPVGSGAPYVATAERIVLHGVVFKLKATGSTSSPCRYWITQCKSSNEVQNHLSTLRSGLPRIQAKSTCRNCTLTNPRTRAVASYFEQRGISASRLVLLSSGSPRSLKQNFEVVQLDLASR